MTTLHSLWQSVLEEGKELKEGFEDLREFVDLRVENLLAKPNLIRPLFGYLREHHPIFHAPKLVAVARFDDVCEVLANDRAFGVTSIYLEKMQATTGAFVLGLPDSDQYRREIGLMQAATHTGDIERIATYTAEAAGNAVNCARSAGSMDAVAQLSRLVPTKLVGDYFGAPGESIPTTQRWMRSIFRHIFLNLGNDPNMAEDADKDAKELSNYLDAHIEMRRSQLAVGEAVPDDFLTRLAAMREEDGTLVPLEVVRRIVGGTIVGAVDTNSKAIAQALDVLLSRPDALAEAQAAAISDNDDFLAHIVFEALRFNPQNPFLIRHCDEPATIAAGTDRATEVKVGTLVLVGTESAMFDPEKFPDPNAFKTDRPLDSYIHFGVGLHACFGRLIGGTVIPGTLKPLLKLKGLRRAHGQSEIIYDGAFPDHLFVEFDTE